MYTERDELIDRLLQAALGLAPKMRPVFLAEACGGDDALRREVESLLAHGARTGGILEEPVFPVVPPASRARGRDGADAGDDDEVFAAMRPGVRIADQFTVVRELGRGGFGLVLLCRDWRGKPCAAKTPLRRGLRDPGQLALFRQEVLRWIRLGNHPHVVMAYGMVDFMRLPFIMMEYVEGGESLSDLVEGGRTDWRSALAFGRQVAAGLDHAYRAAGLVHHDVKPGNVLVTPEGQAKVGDFGASVALSHEGEPDLIMWTPSYRAPERLRPDYVSDTRSDVYSLGVMMFELAAGRRPLAGERDGAGDADVRAARADVPPEFAGLIGRCMREDPSARPQEMAAVEAELRGLHESLLGHPPRQFHAAEPPAPVEWAVNLANTFENLGAADEALEAAREAVGLDEEHVHAWNALGNALALKGEHEEAIRAYMRARRLSPADLVSATNLVRCHFGLGDGEGARAWLRRALALAEEAEAVHRLEKVTGEIIELEDHETALGLCDQILAADPRSAVTWNNRAILLRRMGRPAEALYSASRAVELNPAYAKAWVNRANALLALGRFEEALDSAERSLAYEHDLAGAYLAKAAALKNLGRGAEAGACLRQGLREFPCHPLLGEALKRYGAG